MGMKMLCIQEMKTLDKEVRVWDVYVGLESTVKNLLTSLRAVNELQNPAVRERHWQQLMHTTGVEYFNCVLLQNYTEHHGMVTPTLQKHYVYTCYPTCYYPSSLILSAISLY